jgi:hypothetical protein
VLLIVKCKLVEDDKMMLMGKEWEWDIGCWVLGRL